MLLGNEHVKRRHDEQREDRSNCHPADEHETDGVSCGRARATNECERKVTCHGRDAGHHDRTQTNARRLRDGVKLTQTLPLQFVRELNNQDSVFRNESDERDETDLRVNVERRGPAVGEKFSERHLQKQ